MSAPHLFVTGTSGAIGGAIACVLRKRFPDARMTLVDVAEQPSKALAHALRGGEGDVALSLCDLAKSDDAQRVLDEARARFGPVDGLVNCAGFMEVRRFDRIASDRAADLLAVDLVTPLRLMHAAVPEMIARRSGFVVNVTSMAGKVTLPGCAFYGAAKAGLAMASEIARRELAPLGVRVLTVYPGAVASALESRARDQYGRTLWTRLAPTGSPEELAQRIDEALDADRARVIYPALYSLGLVPAAGPLALAFGPNARE